MVCLYRRTIFFYTHIRNLYYICERKNKPLAINENPVSLPCPDFNAVCFIGS